MQFVRVAHVSDFEHERFKSFRLMAKPVAVFKNGDGAFFAREMRCKHQNWDLTTGRLKGDVITCPRHHWQYNIQTGECLNQSSSPLRAHAVEVREDGGVYVSLTPCSEDA